MREREIEQRLKKETEKHSGMWRWKPEHGRHASCTQSAGWRGAHP